MRRVQWRCDHGLVRGAAVPGRQAKQEGQHPLTGQRAANFRLLANQ